MTYYDEFEYGKRYVVLEDSDNVFSTGDIVICVEQGSSVPYFVREKDYNPNLLLSQYKRSMLHPLCSWEVEEYKEEEI